MTQPAAESVQEFSQGEVLVHRSVHPRVQLVMRHDCVLLQVRVHPPPGQSSEHPAPDTLLQRTLQPPPAQRWVHPPTELQSSPQPAPEHC